MRQLLIFLLSLVTIFFAACRKEPGPVEPTPETKGVIRPTGQSIGNGVEKIMGTQGGSITSGDGKLKVEIPAGALNKDVAIGIAPITRTLLDSIEGNHTPAYRITPHGQQFQQPVKITFTYSEEAFRQLTPAAAGVAYQDIEGRWKGIGKVDVNTASGSISVLTKHFSDWTTYESIYLMPQGDQTVEVGSSVNLKVMSVVSMALLEEDRDKEEYFLEEPEYVQAKVAWRIVNGPGNGSVVMVPTLPAAVYTAPASVPPNNPALVEAQVDLKSQGRMLLLKNIAVVETIKPGLHLKINGGSWIHFDDEAFIRGETYYGSDGNFPYDKHSVYLRIAGGQAKGTGTWKWDRPANDEENTRFEYISKNPEPYTSYPHLYRNGDFDVWHTSDGQVTITDYKKDVFGKLWATGEFVIEKSTPFIDGYRGTPPAVKIVGNFKLRIK
jgi:hypothetical protein